MQYAQDRGPEVKRRRLLSCVFAAFLAGPALAETETPVILTIGGLGETIELTLSDLKEMGAASFETSTIWSEGVLHFTGVPLKDLLDRLDITDGRLLARAINDYAVEIPVSDGVEGGPIIAYMMNGEVMSVRNKGPLWLVYPYDLNPEYRSEVIYSRSIWQLHRIDVLP